MGRALTVTTEHYTYMAYDEEIQGFHVSDLWGI